jgi:CPA2 family monovalent cation:H+ antiporter-2
LPLLPAAIALAAVSAATKMATGWYAAARVGIGRRGRLRAGTALIAHGEFSIIVVGLVGVQHPSVGPLVVAYVFALAVTGPLLTRFAGARPARTPARPDGSDR